MTPEERLIDDLAKSNEGRNMLNIVADLRKYAIYMQEPANALDSGSIIHLFDRSVRVIEYLQSQVGAVTLGPSFAEITKDLPRRSGESD